ncbi:transcriptional regulator TACO1-like protein [Aspergillus egyptiacus]|nr:transcriptional regulator TACO1-like protein [Aspergillus egyptiacus]
MASIVSKRLVEQRACASRIAWDLRRSFTSCPSWSAGHNKWSTIKHTKAKNDKAKSNQRSLMVKDITSAVQMSGPDPKFNPRLTDALATAKRAGVPKTVIESAIARGQGLSVSGEALEQITFEAILPHSVAAIIECETENKPRVRQDVRKILKDNGATITPTAYFFEKRGRVIFQKKDGVSADDYLDQAIEAGAADITSDGDGRIVVFTDPSETKSVGDKLAKLAGLAIEGLEMVWMPNRDTMVDLKDEAQIQEIEDLLALIREEPSIRDIYLNATHTF